MRFADRLAMGVIGRAANQTALQFKGGDARLLDEGRDLFDFSHHFGADAVAGQKEQFERRHRVSISCLKAGR